jgi:hypothetical protein
MSQAISPSTHKPYGLARTCRVWEMARSSVYWQRQERAEPGARRGPLGPCTDELVTHIRIVLCRRRHSQVKAIARCGLGCAIVVSVCRLAGCCA